ncbi:MAG: stage II sporulation protein M [Tenericutes bacterium]|nr:stage II sporulation protein M [Mycoplasmatota bacterium]
MKKLILEIKQNKLLLLLTILAIVFTIIGIFFPAILTEANKELIKNNIIKFINKIDNNEINYLSALFYSSWNNILVTFILWILGISLIGIPFIIIIYIFKCFLTGFSFTSILITYGVKGSITAMIYSIPNTLNSFGSLLLSYYALSFSITIYKCIFKRENKNWSTITKQYIKLGIFFLLYTIIISVIESYIIPNILRLL